MKEIAPRSKHLFLLVLLTV